MEIPEGHALSHARQTRQLSIPSWMASLMLDRLSTTARSAAILPRGDSASLPLAKYVGHSGRQSPQWTQSFSAGIVDASMFFTDLPAMVFFHRDPIATSGSLSVSQRRRGEPTEYPSAHKPRHLLLSPIHQRMQLSRPGNRGRNRVATVQVARIPQKERWRARFRLRW